MKVTNYATETKNSIKLLSSEFQTGSQTSELDKCIQEDWRVIGRWASNDESLNNDLLNTLSPWQNRSWITFLFPVVADSISG